MKIESILFDLDNTLLDRQNTFEQYVNAFMSKYIIYNSPEEKKKIKDEIILMDNKGVIDKKELFLKLKKNLEWKSNPSEEFLVQEYKTIFAKMSKVMDGTYEVLSFCRKNNLKMGIITNGEIVYQKIKIKKTNLQCFFDLILISEQVGVTKPHPFIFNSAIDYMDINPKQSVFVGDNIYTDVYGASKLGFYTVWFKHPNIKKERNITIKPDRVITELKELLYLFKVSKWRMKR